MISYPNAKINLGLNIVAKRSDGFHEIESVFYPIDWRDILEIVPDGESTGNAEFSSSGIEIPNDPGGNLCVRAYHTLHEKLNLPSVKIHLHKIIPIGAGLGGGSADASFTLTMLNAMFDLKLSVRNLEEVAADLGSDCPFFVQNTPKMVSGRGEIMEPVDLDLSDYKILLVNPGIHIGTAEAYRNVALGKSEHSLLKTVTLTPENWGERVKNDFENSLFSAYPEIFSIKERLNELGAVYTSMTGSGSTVFGIFKHQTPSHTEFGNYTVKECLL